MALKLVAKTAISISFAHESAVWEGLDEDSQSLLHVEL